MDYKYGLLAKCEVKMAGYWPSSFACRRTRPISSHLDQTNLVNKGFIIWLLVKFCLRDTAGSPVRARWLHLARSGSQSQRVIWFILPARGASHIINIITLVNPLPFLIILLNPLPVLVALKILRDIYIFFNLAIFFYFSMLH